MTQAPPAREEDQRVFLHDVSWEGYEAILRIRGESSAVRITYLDGLLELMSPSIDHEYVKVTTARLLEAWAIECNVEITGYGSWTVKKKKKKRGFEADECYVLGSKPKKHPDLAIEIEWTHGGIDKLDVYRGIGVPEVWWWKDNRFTIYVLRDGEYEAAPRSSLLPGLDLDELTRFLATPSQTQAVRSYLSALRERAE